MIAAPVGSVVATHFHRFVKDLHWNVNLDCWLLTSIIYILPNCYNCLALDLDSYNLPHLGKFWPAWSTFLTRWPLSLRLRFSTWRQSSGFSPSPSLQATLILVLVLNMVFAPTFHNVLCLVSCRWRHILHSSLVGWPEVFQQPWSFIAMELYFYLFVILWCGLILDQWSWKKPNISAIFQIAHFCGQEENREWKQTRSMSRQPPCKKGLKTTNVEKGVCLKIFPTYVQCSLNKTSVTAIQVNHPVCNEDRNVNDGNNPWI